jgi:hypothetical protein
MLICEYTTEDTSKISINSIYLSLVNKLKIKKIRIKRIKYMSYHDINSTILIQYII